MKGLGVRYFAARPSRKRSGSNVSAFEIVSVFITPTGALENLTIWSPQILAAMHDEYRVQDSAIVSRQTWLQITIALYLPFVGRDVERLFAWSESGPYYRLCGKTDVEGTGRILISK